MLTIYPNNPKNAISPQKQTIGGDPPTGITPHLKTISVSINGTKRKTPKSFLSPKRRVLIIEVVLAS